MHCSKPLSCRPFVVAAGFLLWVLLAASSMWAQDVSFIAARQYAAGRGPYSVAVGDFNGDGVQDLAVANYSSGNVSVLLGNGDGTFQAAVNYATGSNPLSVAVGDFNGDCKPDLAVADSGGGVSILINTSLNPILSVTIKPHPSVGRVTSNPAGIDCSAGACYGRHHKNVDTTGTDWRRAREAGISCDKWGSFGGSSENGMVYAYR